MLFKWFVIYLTLLLDFAARLVVEEKKNSIFTAKRNEKKKYELRGTTDRHMFAMEMHFFNERPHMHLQSISRLFFKQIFAADNGQCWYSNDEVGFIMILIVTLSPIQFV